MSLASASQSKFVILQVCGADHLAVLVSQIRRLRVSCCSDTPNFLKTLFFAECTHYHIHISSYQCPSYDKLVDFLTESLIPLCPGLSH
jgi:hypothetical protein